MNLMRLILLMGTLCLICCLPVSGQGGMNFNAGGPGSVHPGDSVHYWIFWSSPDPLEGGVTVNIDPNIVISDHYGGCSQTGPNNFDCPANAVHGSYDFIGIVKDTTPDGTVLYFTADGIYYDFFNFPQVYTYPQHTSIRTLVIGYPVPEFPDMTIPAVIMIAFIGIVTVMSRP